MKWWPLVTLLLFSPAIAQYESPTGPEVAGKTQKISGDANMHKAQESIQEGGPPEYVRPDNSPALAAPLDSSKMAPETHENGYNGSSVEMKMEEHKESSAETKPSSGESSKPVEGASSAGAASSGGSSSESYSALAGLSAEAKPSESAPSGSPPSESKTPSSAASSAEAGPSGPAPSDTSAGTASSGSAPSAPVAEEHKEPSGEDLYAGVGVPSHSGETPSEENSAPSAVPSNEAPAVKPSPDVSVTSGTDEAASEEASDAAPTPSEATKPASSEAAAQPERKPDLAEPVSSSASGAATSGESKSSGDTNPKPEAKPSVIPPVADNYAALTPDAAPVSSEAAPSAPTGGSAEEKLKSGEDSNSDAASATAPEAVAGVSVSSTGSEGPSSGSEVSGTSSEAKPSGDDYSVANPEETPAASAPSDSPSGVASSGSATKEGAQPSSDIIPKASEDYNVAPKSETSQPTVGETKPSAKDVPIPSEDGASSAGSASSGSSSPEASKPSEDSYSNQKEEGHKNGKEDKITPEIPSVACKHDEAKEGKSNMKETSGEGSGSAEVGSSGSAKSGEASTEGSGQDKYAEPSGAEIEDSGTGPIPPSDNSVVVSVASTVNPPSAPTKDEIKAAALKPYSSESSGNSVEDGKYASKEVAGEGSGAVAKEGSDSKSGEESKSSEEGSGSAEEQAKGEGPAEMKSSPDTYAKPSEESNGTPDKETPDASTKTKGGGSTYSEGAKHVEELNLVQEETKEVVKKEEKQETQSTAKTVPQYVTAPGERTAAPGVTLPPEASRNEDGLPEEQVATDWDTFATVIPPVVEQTEEKRTDYDYSEFVLTTLTTTESLTSTNQTAVTNRRIVSSPVEPSGYEMQHEPVVVNSPELPPIKPEEAVGYDGIEKPAVKPLEEFRADVPQPPIELLANSLVKPVFKTTTEKPNSAETKASGWTRYRFDCETEEDDKGPLCKEWALGGLCEQHKPTMFLFCRKTCLCTGPLARRRREALLQ